MNDRGGGIGRWVLAAILSALAHGFVILAVVVIWSSWILPNSSTGIPSNNVFGKSSTVFWDPPATPNAAMPATASNAHPDDVIPLTAQLSPLAMVSTDTKPVDPVRKMLRHLRGSTTKALPETLPTSTGSREPSSAGWFASETTGERLAIVIDRSLSMGLGGGWEAARREARIAISNAPPDCLMRVWVFDKTTEEIASEGDWMPWTKQRRLRALDRLEETRPGGSTDLAGALRTATLRGASRIVIVSDDADLLAGNWGAIVTTLRRIGRQPPRLCTVRLGQQMRVDNLGDLCRQSGGWCRLEAIR